jgi:hypothetical protein
LPGVSPRVRLERRATENYFTAEALRGGLGGHVRALGPFEHLKNHPSARPKRRNGAIAASMSRADIEATDLGQFLLRLGARGSQ